MSTNFCIRMKRGIDEKHEDPIYCKQCGREESNGILTIHNCAQIAEFLSFPESGIKSLRDKPCTKNNLCNSCWPICDGELDCEMNSWMHCLRYLQPCSACSIEQTTTTKEPLKFYCIGHLHLCPGCENFFCDSHVTWCDHEDSIDVNPDITCNNKMCYSCSQKGTRNFQKSIKYLERDATGDLIDIRKSNEEQDTRNTLLWFYCKKANLTFCHLHIELEDFKCFDKNCDTFCHPCIKCDQVCNVCVGVCCNKHSQIIDHSHRMCSSCKSKIDQLHPKDIDVCFECGVCHFCKKYY